MHLLLGTSNSLEITTKNGYSVFPKFLVKEILTKNTFLLCNANNSPQGKLLYFFLLAEFKEISS